MKCRRSHKHSPWGTLRTGYNFSTYIFRVVSGRLGLRGQNIQHAYPRGEPQQEWCQIRWGTDTTISPPWQALCHDCRQPSSHLPIPKIPAMGDWDMGDLVCHRGLSRRRMPPSSFVSVLCCNLICDVLIYQLSSSLHDELFLWIILGLIYIIKQTKNNQTCQHYLAPSTEIKQLKFNSKECFCPEKPPNALSYFDRTTLLSL